MNTTFLTSFCVAGLLAHTFLVALGRIDAVEQLLRRSERADLVVGPKAEKTAA